MKTARALAVCLSLIPLAACSGVSSPSSYTPDDFSGLLPPGGEINRGFSVGATGEIQVQLTALNPLPRVGFIAMAVGQYAGTVCSPLQGMIISQAAVNQQYALGRITRGSYCITVADPNQVVTSPSTFTVRMLHP
jgi:hypothetical protein